MWSVCKMLYSENHMLRLLCKVTGCQTKKKPKPKYQTSQFLANFLHFASTLESTLQTVYTGWCFVFCMFECWCPAGAVPAGSWCVRPAPALRLPVLRQEVPVCIREKEEMCIWSGFLGLVFFFFPCPKVDINQTADKAFSKTHTYLPDAAVLSYI